MNSEDTTTRPAPEATRFPRSVYSRGTEPDARFTLANERTFLAWISTGLALISVGVGLKSVALNLQPGLRLASAILLVLAGTATPVQAWHGWRRVETALRQQQPLPTSTMTPILPAILGAAGILIVIALFIP